MRFLFRALPVLAATATTLCLSSAVLAQDAPASPAPPMGGEQHHQHDHAEWRKAHAERRARFLHDVLNIRADQEAAFQTYLADSRPKMHDHDGPGHGDWGDHKDASAPPMTTPERLDRMADLMAKRTARHQAAFQQRAQAVKRFYAALSPDQRKAFDALHDLRGGRGEGRPEGGLGEGGDHGPADHGRGQGDEAG